MTADGDAGALFLTGATGFVGTELLARFVERTDRRVYVLVRAADADEADARLNDVLTGAVGDAAALAAGQIVAVRGDIQQPGLGLDEPQRRRLAGEVRDIVHAAASVSFDLPLDEARAINVEGTRHVLEFAELCNEHGGLHRMCHVSTAYVAGDHEGVFGEEDLEVGQEFRNTYERTKFEAERLLRVAGRRLPVQVLRPSIVVGERDSGWTSSFNVLYAPLRAFARGRLAALPARTSAPIDVVPVDYVADAAFELLDGPPSDNRTFHLVAGRHASTIGRLIDLSARQLDRPRPLVLDPGLYRRLVHPLLMRSSDRNRRGRLERLAVYFPYLEARVRYDDETTRRRLEPAGVRTAPLERFYDRLVAFAERAAWGREPVGRAEARREAGGTLQGRSSS
jgi:thioester reductase-like protein